MKLVKRTDPRMLNPENCCFIFPMLGRPFFRVYHRDGKKSFTDYDVAAEVTPFVKLISDDVELKEYLQDDGEIMYLMDFPEPVLRSGPTYLGPGEVWEPDASSMGRKEDE